MSDDIIFQLGIDTVVERLYYYKIRETEIYALGNVSSDPFSPNFQYFERIYRPRTDGSWRKHRERLFGRFPADFSEAMLTAISLGTYLLIPGVRRRMADEREFQELCRRAESDGAVAVCRKS